MTVQGAFNSVTSSLYSCGNAVYNAGKSVCNKTAEYAGHAVKVIKDHPKETAIAGLALAALSGAATYYLMSSTPKV